MTRQYLDQGSSRTWEVVVYDTLVQDAAGNVDEELSTRKDLTGASVVYRIGLATVPYTTLQKTGSITDPAQGVLQVELTAAESESLAAADYDHQFIVTDGAGHVSVVRRERVRVRPLLPEAV